LKIKLFTKKGCIKCPTAKRLCEELSNKINIESYLVDETNGITEANHYEVISTPSIILVDDKDKEIKSFRGTVPTKEELIGAINAN